MEQDDFVLLSALQHYTYCPRQCALIHAEQSFADNVYTARGNAVHRLADRESYEQRAGVRIERALPLVCEKLGLIGKADIVEYLLDGTPYPVEYKHGPLREQIYDDIQLAAQLICLEEMMNCSVPYGAIYHASSHKRREVAITDTLRCRVAETTTLIHKLLQSGVMPPPCNDARCCGCSLADLCQPEMLSNYTERAAIRKALFKVED